MPCAPGGHVDALYAVAADGSGLTRQLEFNGTLAMLAIEHARKEVGATEAGAAVAGDLDEPPTEQRIATFVGGALQWHSPADLFAYEYDWRPAGEGFVGTAASGDGEDNWWVAKLYAFAPGGAARVLYTPTGRAQQLADPSVSRDGKTVAFIAGIMSDFGSTGGDVYSMSFDGSAALNLTPKMRGSVTALVWSCQNTLRAELLAGDQSQIADLGSGRVPVTRRCFGAGP